MKTVIVRADSSSTIGTGHIMRDLVLAEREFAGDRVIFAVRDLPGNINDRIREAGYETVLLHTDRIEELAELAGRERADTIVIDHYGIGWEEEKRLKELTGARLFVLDDTYERHYCDVLLNHNICAETQRYVGLVPEGCRVLCGREHLLLRREFLEARRSGAKRSSRDQERRRICVAMGGADHSQINIPILEVLKSMGDADLHVVTTSANPGLDRLGRYAREHQITLHVDTDTLAEILVASDLVIVSPSVILNEVLYLELPFVAIRTADNQAEMVAYLKEKRLPVLEAYEPTALKRLLWGLRAGENVQSVPFQDLPEKGLLQVLSWRNHPEIRRWMFQTEPIREEEHRTFVRSLDRRGDRLYRLVKERGVPVGVFDLTQIDHRASGAYIGIYTDPETRGKGKVVMDALLHEAFARQKLDRLIAEVFEENERAIRLYRHYGFEVVGKVRYHDRELLRMVKEL